MRTNGCRCHYEFNLSTFIPKILNHKHGQECFQLLRKKCRFTSATLYYSGLRFLVQKHWVRIHRSTHRWIRIRKHLHMNRPVKKFLIYYFEMLVWLSAKNDLALKVPKVMRTFDRREKLRRIHHFPNILAGMRRCDVRGRHAMHPIHLHMFYYLLWSLLGSLSWMNPMIDWERIFLCRRALCVLLPLAECIVNRAILFFHNLHSTRHSCGLFFSLSGINKACGLPFRMAFTFIINHTAQLCCVLRLRVAVCMIYQTITTIIIIRNNRYSNRIISAWRR